MEDEPKMASSFDAIPMPYVVSEIDQNVKKEDKFVNKNMKTKSRKRNKGNVVVENDDDTKNV